MGLLILGILVVVHEFGHFAVSRLAGVRVLEFGIGFPPRAKVLRSEGETLYTLNWLPIGGFVKLEGEEGSSDDPRAFSRAPLLTRLLILVAGVVMNLLLAFLIMFAIAWVANPTRGIQFGGVQPGSPAEQADLQRGDTIVSLNGQYYDAYGGMSLVEDIREHAGMQVTLGLGHVRGIPERHGLGLDRLGLDCARLRLDLLRRVERDSLRRRSHERRMVRVAGRAALVDDP